MDDLIYAMSELNRQAQALVEEFERVTRLNRTRAYRSTFLVLALLRNWSQARIARYLGVSRARVGQKVIKCRRYARVYRDEMPVLAKKMQEYDRRKNISRVSHGKSIEFSYEHWEREEFAVGLLNQIAN